MFPETFRQESGVGKHLSPHVGEVMVHCLKNGSKLECRPRNHHKYVFGGLFPPRYICISVFINLEVLAHAHAHTCTCAHAGFIVKSTTAPKILQTGNDMGGVQFLTTFYPPCL